MFLQMRLEPVVEEKAPAGHQRSPYGGTGNLANHQRLGPPSSGRNRAQQTPFLVRGNIRHAYRARSASRVASSLSHGTADDDDDADNVDVGAEVDVVMMMA